MPNSILILWRLNHEEAKFVRTNTDVLDMAGMVRHNGLDELVRYLRNIQKQMQDWKKITLGKLVRNK